MSVGKWPLVISRIPTPNALVDTSLWPVVKVTLGGRPSEDEYRISLGRLRALRTRNAPHFIVVDARELEIPPPRYVEMRILTFVFESIELAGNCALGVCVIATRDVLHRAVMALQHACNRTASKVLVFDMASAMDAARQTLGSDGRFLFELMFKS